MMANSMDAPKLRSLYRQLLREAKKFPSVKRAAIYQDIRAEWRDNSRLSDPKKIRHAIEIGVRGLDTMQKYTGLNKRSSSWSITLEQDPLGAGLHQQAQEEQQKLQEHPQPSNNNKQPNDEFEIINNNLRKLE